MAIIPFPPPVNDKTAFLVEPASCQIRFAHLQVDAPDPAFRLLFRAYAPQERLHKSCSEAMSPRGFCDHHILNLPFGRMRGPSHQETVRQSFDLCNQQQTAR